MATETEIVNEALVKLKAQRIASLDDVTAAAKLAKASFPRQRDYLLASNSWNFNTRRTSLAANSLAPDWGFDLAYDLPVDPNYCLKAMSVNGEDEDSARWRVEGRQILTDITAPLELLYRWRNLDYGDYPAEFVEALASRCAWQWCWHLTGSSELRAQLAIEARRALAEARGIEGAEGMHERRPRTSWIRSRFETWR